MVLVSPPCFMIGHVGGALPVHAHDVVLDLVGVLGLADVAHRNPALADGLDRKLVQIFTLSTRLLE